MPLHLEEFIGPYYHEEPARYEFGRYQLGIETGYEYETPRVWEGSDESEEEVPTQVAVAAPVEEPREDAVSVRSSFGNLEIDMNARVRTPSPDSSPVRPQDSETSPAVHGLDDPDRYISESDQAAGYADSSSRAIMVGGGAQ